MVVKPAPTKSHSKVQRRLIEISYELNKCCPFHAFPELRGRTTETRARIPDVAIYAGPEPEEEVPSLPPYIAVEILSPDDRVSYLWRDLPIKSRMSQ